MEGIFGLNFIFYLVIPLRRNMIQFSVFSQGIIHWLNLTISLLGCGESYEAGCGLPKQIQEGYCH